MIRVSYDFGLDAGETHLNRWYEKAKCSCMNLAKRKVSGPSLKSYLASASSENRERCLDSRRRCSPRNVVSKASHGSKVV